MILTNEEKQFKNNVIEIVRKNQNDKRKGIDILASLKFNGKTMGKKKAKEIYNLYIHEVVDFTKKKANYDYIHELNTNYNTMNTY